MVFLAENFRRLMASCWSLLVIKGGQRGALDGFPVDLFHHKVKVVEFLHNGSRCIPVRDVDLFSVPAGQLGGEGRGTVSGEICSNGPVLLGFKGPDLSLPVADDLNGNRLNPAGAESPPGPAARAGEISGIPPVGQGFVWPVGLHTGPG